MTGIVKASGYLTEDGKMFQTLDEAAEHKYTKDLKAALGEKASCVFGVRTILAHSEEIEQVLAAYNAEKRRLEGQP